MGRYLNRILMADEQIIYAAQLHWYIYLRGLTTLIIGAVLGRYGFYVIAYLLGPDIGQMVIKPVKIAAMVVIAYGAFELFIAYIHQISTELVITNRRVVAKYGFVATTTFELMIPKVEGANIDQTVFGRLLGFGTVLVKGTGGGISPIDHVSNPFRFHDVLMQTIEQAQRTGAR